MTADYDLDDDQFKEPLQIDVYGIKARFAPVEPDTPPDSWREVWRRVHQALMSIASDSFTLVADAISATRTTIKGLATLPLALSSRIAGAHKTIESRENHAEQQLPDRSLIESELVEEIESVAGRLQAKGVAVHFQQIGKGRIIVSLTTLSQQQVACELANSAIHHALDVPLLSDAEPNDPNET